MKLYLALVAALVSFSTACSKPNEAATLQHEVNAIVVYNQPKLEALDKRVQQIFRRGTTIPANLPGIEEVGRRLTEARDLIVKQRSAIGRGPDGKSPVQKQAETAARERRIVELEKLLHETESSLARDLTIINDDLASVESWIALYDQARIASPKSVPPPPDPNAQPAAPAAPAPAPPAAAPAPAPPAARPTP